MLALKYQSYGRTFVESTNDYQSIFDMVYNLTGEHEHAMRAYNAVTNLKWGQKADVTYLNVTVTVICYNEVTHNVDHQGNIVKKQNTKHRVLSVEDAVNAIGVVANSCGEVEGIIFANDVWTARVVARQSVVRYFADYNYKDGRHGTIEIQVVNDRPVVRTSGIQVIQPIIDKITNINKRMHNKNRRR